MSFLLPPKNDSIVERSSTVAPASYYQKHRRTTPTIRQAHSPIQAPFVQILGRPIGRTHHDRPQGKQDGKELRQNQGIGHVGD